MVLRRHPDPADALAVAAARPRRTKENQLTTGPALVLPVRRAAVVRRPPRPGFLCVPAGRRGEPGHRRRRAVHASSPRSWSRPCRCWWGSAWSGRWRCCAAAPARRWRDALGAFFIWQSTVAGRGARVGAGPVRPQGGVPAHAEDQRAGEVVGGAAGELGRVDRWPLLGLAGIAAGPDQGRPNWPGRCWRPCWCFPTLGMAAAPFNSWAAQRAALPPDLRRPRRTPSRSGRTAGRSRQRGGRRRRWSRCRPWSSRALALLLAPSPHVQPPPLVSGTSGASSHPAPGPSRTSPPATPSSSQTPTSTTTPTPTSSPPATPSSTPPTAPSSTAPATPSSPAPHVAKREPRRLTASECGWGGPAACIRGRRHSSVSVRARPAGRASDSRRGTAMTNQTEWHERERTSHALQTLARWGKDPGTDGGENIAFSLVRQGAPSDAFQVSGDCTPFTPHGARGTLHGQPAGQHRRARRLHRRLRRDHAWPSTRSRAPSPSTSTTGGSG